MSRWWGVYDEAKMRRRGSRPAPEHLDRGRRQSRRRALRHLFQERGHHRATIDPAVENERAIRSYERIRFRPVGILRRAERAPDGRWRDALLMDLLAEELRDPN